MPRWNQFTEQKLSALSASIKRKRVEFFIRRCSLGPSDTVLDLGSEDGSYLASVYPYPHNIVLADVAEAPMRGGVRRYGLKGYQVIPDTGPLPFASASFDAVWCNSVIEHVTIPRSELGQASEVDFVRRAEAHQRVFCAEIARIGKRYCVQTPYVHFPIEAHAWLPFIQYLPHPQRFHASSLLKRIWVKQWTADYLLYDLSRFKAHFPNATAVLFERVLGLPKALIAIRA